MKKYIMGLLILLALALSWFIFPKYKLAEWFPTLGFESREIRCLRVFISDKDFEFYQTKPTRSWLSEDRKYITVEYESGKGEAYSYNHRGAERCLLWFNGDIDEKGMVNELIDKTNTLKDELDMKRQQLKDMKDKQNNTEW